MYNEILTKVQCMHSELLAEVQGVKLINWEEHTEKLKEVILEFVKKEKESVIRMTAVYSRSGSYVPKGDYDFLLIKLIEKVIVGYNVLNYEDINVLNLSDFLKSQGFAITKVSCGTADRYAVDLKSLSVYNIK